MPPLSLSEYRIESAISWTDDCSCGSTIDISNLKIEQNEEKAHLSKGVSFAEEKEVFEVLHLEDVTKEENLSAWYKGLDYVKFKRTAKLTVVLMEAGVNISDPDYTTIGLEHRTQTGMEIRCKCRRDAYAAVLEEQEIQREGGYNDVEKIAEKYVQHTFESSKRAILRALPLVKPDEEEEIQSDWEIESDCSWEELVQLTLM